MAITLTAPEKLLELPAGFYKDFNSAFGGDTTDTLHCSSIILNDGAATVAETAVYINDQMTRDASAASLAEVSGEQAARLVRELQRRYNFSRKTRAFQAIMRRDIIGPWGTADTDDDTNGWRQVSVPFAVASNDLQPEVITGVVPVLPPPRLARQLRHVLGVDSAELAYLKDGKFAPHGDFDIPHGTSVEIASATDLQLWPAGVIWRPTINSFESIARNSFTLRQVQRFDTWL